MAKKTSREDWLNKSLRNLQKTAAQYNEALGRKEQEENNYLLSLRIEERKAARPNMSANEILKEGTPEEKAEIIARDFDFLRLKGEGCITPEEKKAIYSSFTERQHEDRAAFANYLKLYTDLGDFGDRFLYVYKMYQVEIALLSKLISKYESIQKEMTILEILYGSLVMSKGHSGMSYNLQDNDKTKMKRLDDTTPEALLAEMNEVHKKDGVIFKVVEREHPDDGWTYSPLEADIYYKGGLYDQIKEQAETCKIKLSYVKSYIEPVTDYLNKNQYWKFAPLRLTAAIKDIWDETFSRDIIAPEYHFKEMHDRAEKGEKVTKQEMDMAVVPAYYAVETDEEIVRSCVRYIKRRRNEPPKTE